MASSSFVELEPRGKGRGAVVVAGEDLPVGPFGLQGPVQPLHFPVLPADGVALRPSGSWTPAVLALLRHLEDVGFVGAPPVVGDGYAADGRMAVGYVEGDNPHPGAWDSDKVAQVGALLRGVHDATSTFTADPGARWQRTWLHERTGPEEVVIGHGDPAPWNIVGHDGNPEALIDWEFAGPIDRMTELAYAVWLNAQLHDDDIADLQGLPDGRTRARQAHAILDGYEVPAEQREHVLDRMLDVAVHSARAEAIAAAVTPDSTQAVDDDGYPVLWAISWRARSASWMIRHRTTLLNPR